VKHKELVQLIRRIAREEAYEVIDKHLDDYEHKGKPPENVMNKQCRQSKSKP